MIIRLIVLLCIVFTAAPMALEREKRTSFPIKLCRLQVTFSQQSNRFEYVRILNPDKLESYTQIGPLNDYQLRASGDGREKTEYREDPNTSTALSVFEAEQLMYVCETFAVTLNGFEDDLRNKRWDRLCYLDAYLPRFLRGFYYLYTAARADPKSLPRRARLNDSLYDVSENSAKTDVRIAYWRQHEDMQIKLRMAAKELQFQMREWQRKELSLSKRNPEQAYGVAFEKAFTLFVKVYFENATQNGDGSDDDEPADE